MWPEWHAEIESIASPRASRAAKAKAVVGGAIVEAMDNEVALASLGRAGVNA